MHTMHLLKVSYIRAFLPQKRASKPSNKQAAVKTLDRAVGLSLVMIPTAITVAADVYRCVGILRNYYAWGTLRNGDKRETNCVRRASLKYAVFRSMRNI